MPSYKAYGLTIRSDLGLPALPQADASKSDIEILASHIGANAGGRTKFRNWEAEPGRYLGHFHGIGRFLVTGGNRIEYDRDSSADDSQVASILLGSALAAVLMQRQLIPLHCCSVLTETGAVLVIGRSGAGKSTLLGGLMSLGLPMMADDVTALDIDANGTPVAIPAFPASRLWLDSLTRLGHDSAGLDQVRTDMEKFYLPVDAFHAHPAPVRAIVHLVPTSSGPATIEPIEPAMRLETLSTFIFRKNFIDGLDLRRFAFDRVARTVNQTTMLRARRPSGPVDPTDMARSILENVEAAEKSSLSQMHAEN